MDTLIQLETRYNGSRGESVLLEYGHYSLYASVVYVVTIFSIQRWMKDRQKLDLRGPLFLWSLTLAVFSLATTIVSLPKFLHYWYLYGFERVSCDCVIFDDPRTGLWAFLFVFAKILELGDTIFIVLRKQKLIFLHWYHHITVMCYGWNFSYSHRICYTQSFMSMNCFIHSIMYGYYAVRAQGRYRPPLGVNMMITLLQLIQMIIGTYVNLYIYYRRTIDPNWYCDGKAEKEHHYVYFSLAMYFSYFVLFAHFFYVTYVSKGRGEKKGVKVTSEFCEKGQTDTNTQLLNGNHMVVANGLRHR